MRYTATAAALAISASLAAGDVEFDWELGGPATKSSKSSTTSTKSGKSGDCTSCTAGTLTRANMLTSLVYSSWSVDGVINEESVEDYCKADPVEKEAFLQAVENTAGCLVDAQCFVKRFTEKVYIRANATITEGAFEATAINGLCKAEQKGVILPVGECNAVDVCDAINGGGGIPDGLLGDVASLLAVYRVKIDGVFTSPDNYGRSFTADELATKIQANMGDKKWLNGVFLKALKDGVAAREWVATSSGARFNGFFTSFYYRPS